MNKYRYPSMLDNTQKIDELEKILQKIGDVKIIEITHSIISISDGLEEYDYDDIDEAIDEWSGLCNNISN